MSHTCAFCLIAAGQEDARLVLESDDLVAFLDRRPLFPGHTLLIPRTHFETLADLPAAALSPIFAAVQLLSLAIPEAMGAQGTFVAMNNRVSQSVPHLHVHIVPRTKGDGLRGFFWPRHKYGGSEEMADVARRIREAAARLGGAGAGLR